MINSLCGSMAPMGDSSSRQPISPTASVSESNVTGDLIQENISTVHSNFSGQGMAQTSDPADHHDVEAHFLDSSIWDTIFNEEILDSHTDMMISSPIRVINAPVHPPSFNSLISEDETQHILDSSSPLQFLSSRYCNDSPANFCNFNQKPNIKLELTDLPASPSTNMNPPRFDRPNYSLQKPVMSSNSSLFGDYEAKDGMSGHESSCIIHRVPSAPQLSHKADQPPRSRKAKVEPLPISAPRPVGHGRSQSNDCFGLLPRSPSPTLPNLPHSVPSMLDYLSSPTQRTNSLIHNSGPPPMQLLNLQHNMHAVHQQKPDIGSPEELDAQDSGLQLVHLLLACAEAVAREDYLVAHRTLVQLKQVVCPLGDSMQRVASCFTEALHARLMGTGGRSYAALRAYDLISSEEVMNAYQILYQACPYIKFAHFTANQAIFEAFEGEERVHIIDLDIVQGYQWPAFVQALAARPGGAPHLRITGVGMPLEAVQETGKRLADLAESLHVPFEFHAVGERLENLQAHMFQRRIGEALAVNSVNRIHRLLSEQTSLSAILSMIREQGPNIVTLVEQEASHNGPFFLGRFLEALHYYSAIFDSLDATLPQNNPERTKVEQLIFASEICNIVACEGSERVERHEKLEKWRKIMESKGFQNVALSANAVNQSKLLLGLYPCDGYRLSEDKGSLLLGWQDRSIIAASAWHC